MNKSSICLTVFFEDPFWVGVFERQAQGALTVCKVTFGAEPKDGEVYAFVLRNYASLRFSPAVAARSKHMLKIPNVPSAGPRADPPDGDRHKGAAGAEAAAGTTENRTSNAASAATRAGKRKPVRAEAEAMEKRSTGESNPGWKDQKKVPDFIRRRHSPGNQTSFLLLF